MSSTITRRPSVGALILTLVAGVAWAQGTKPSAQTGDIDQQVRAAQQQLLEAAVRGDKDGVSKYVADDLAWVGRDGAVQTKGQMLAALPAPVRSVDVTQVVPMGSAAAVVAIVHMNDGTDRRALQEWVNSGGQWKVTAHESTAINEQAAPTIGTAGRARAGTSAMSEASTVEPSLTSDAERAVWDVQKKIAEAFSKGDVKEYSKLTADPFTRIQTNGQIYNRGQWLDFVARNAKQPLKNGAISDVKIDVDNDVARATMQIVPFNADGTQGTPERQTRIFAQRNGQWQQVAAISAPLSQR